MDVSAVSAEESSLDDFRALYRAFHGFVWHALYRFGTQDGALEDAVQDVFIVVYRRRETFTGDSTKAWLYGISRRVASNYRRGDRRRSERERAFRTIQPQHVREGTREAIQALDRYLATLPERDRELFVLSELEGMTGPEIAKARGRNVRTIYTRIRKLRLDFRAELLDDVRNQRPQANARSWVMLLPALQPATVATAVAATGWGAALGSSWFAASAGAAGAAALLVIVAQVLPATPSLAPSLVDAASVAPPPERRIAAHPTLRQPVPQKKHAAPTTPVTTTPTQAPGRPPATAASTPQATPRPMPPREGMAAENALLGEATAALRDGQADRALELTDEHTQRFPRSAVKDLRITIRIESLCALGKAKQARGEAATFDRLHPGSPFSTRVRESCSAPQENRPAPDTAGT